MKDGIPLARSRQARDTDATRISTARSKCAWRARRCRRPSTIPPLLVRVIHQADVIVTRIVRDLLAGPSRLVEEFVFARELNLRDHQPSVITLEHIHLPNMICVRHLVPHLFDQRSRAEQIEHLLGVIARYRGLVFVAPHTPRRALDIEEGLVAMHLTASAAAAVKTRPLYTSDRARSPRRRTKKCRTRKYGIETRLRDASGREGTLGQFTVATAGARILALSTVSRSCSVGQSRLSYTLTSHSGE